MNLGSLITTLGVDTRGLDTARRDMDSFTNTVERESRKAQVSLERVGQAMQNMGETLSMYVTIPLAAAGAGAFVMAKDFEKSMSLIVGLVGISSKQVNAWKEDILKMGPELGKSPQELAQALYFITSAGITGAEAMDVLRMSAKAAASGLGKTEDIANLVTSAMNAYGIQNLSAAEATDILVTAVREGKGEAAAFAATVSSVLPVATEMGLSFDQVSAAMAAMTRTGAPAAEAATQVRGVLMGLMSPSDQAAEVLGSMGMSFEMLREQMREKGLIAMLINLRQVLAENKYEMSDVFTDVRALTGALDLTGRSVEQNILVFDSLRNSTGALDDAFKAAVDTMDKDWRDAVSASQAALIRLGAAINQTFLPILQGITRALESTTVWFASLSEGSQRMVVVIGAVVAALGPLMIALGFIIKELIPLLITGLKNVQVALKYVIVQLGIFQGFMLKNPAMAWLVGIAAVTGALLSMRKQADDTRTAIDSLAETMNRLEGASQSFRDLWARGQVLETMDLRQTQAFQQSIKEAIQREQDAILEYQTIVKGIGERELKFVEMWFAQREELSKLLQAVPPIISRIENNQVVFEGGIFAGGQEAQAYRQALEKRKELESQMSPITLQILAATDERSWVRSKERLVQFDALAQKTQARIDELEIDTQPTIPNMQLIAPPDPMQELLKELGMELEFISEMSEALGLDFDVASAKAETFGKALQTALRIPGIDVSNEYVQEFINRIKELQTETSLLAKNQAFETLHKELEFALQMYMLQGDELDFVTSSIQAQQRAVEELTMAWLGLEMPEDVRVRIQELLTVIKALKSEQAGLQLKGSIEESLLSLEQQIALIEWRGKVEGASFDVLSEKASAYEAMMMRIASMDLSAEQLDELTDKWLQARDAAEAYQQKAQFMNMLTQNLASGFFSLGETIGNAMVTGAQGMDIMKAATVSMGNTVLDILQQTVNMMLVKAIAGLFAAEVSTKGVIGLATAAIGIGILKAMWQHHTGSIPRAYKGAIAHGDTAIRVGDYAGASSINPEVIAPLSDLKNYLGNAGGGVARIDLRVAGPDLYAVWEKEHIKRKNNR